MPALNRLSSALGSRDEKANIALAKTIALKNDANAVKELVNYLHDKNKNIQSNCIKVLYEAASINPSLIAPYHNEFIALLEHPSNRLAWGAMIALKLCRVKRYQEHALNMLILQLLESPENQLPMYAERALPAINSKNKDRFIATLNSRMEDLDSDAKKKRVMKVIKGLLH